MTLIGMEKALNYQNRSITDDWSLDNEAFDKQILMAAIITKGGQFEPVYPDPDYFYMMCRFWWAKWSRTFNKWFDAFAIEYNPLENYDRNESWHEDITDEGSLDTTTSNTEVVDDNNSSESTQETTVSSYDSSDYSPKDKVVSTSSAEDDRTVTNSGTVGSETSNDRDVTHSGRIHGNIGVTTSQQMLESELKIQRFNIYDQIADIFATQLLVKVF